MTTHLVPSGLYVVLAHAEHDPSTGWYPTSHFVQEGTPEPLLPSLHLEIVVHVLPSLPYEVPGQAWQAPFTSLYPALHLVHTSAAALLSLQCGMAVQDVPSEDSPAAQA